MELELTRFGGLSFTCQPRRGLHAKTHPPYPAEFRQRIVELAQAGRSVQELAAEFEPSEQTIRNWIVQARLDDMSPSERAHAEGLSTAEREELSQLRKENRRLQQERDILAKAAAWFAQETNVIAPRSSRS